MKIKNIRAFRTWYKEKVAKINDPNRDEHYIGYQHQQGGEESERFGFINLVHGVKPSIKNFLTTPLNIAQDDQAIYEFIQNAADAKSTAFYIFYNETEFLAINNGNTFSLEDIQSIINISNSTKKGCDSIGRFGIGFKLVHRLVGKGNGYDEMEKFNKGLSIFSWNKLTDFKELLGEEEEIELEFDDNLEGESPWLTKILLATTPVHPSEDIKNLDYEEKVLFSLDELKDLRDFLKSNKDNILNIDENFQKGSLFYLKLGEGKQEKLKENENNLTKGVGIAMNFLKNLRTVKIADNRIVEKKFVQMIKFTLQPNEKEYSEIFGLAQIKVIEKEGEHGKRYYKNDANQPENELCPLEVVYGYEQGGRFDKESPNFYKYFPMGDETNNFAFVLQCNEFKIATDRRKLEVGDENKRLFEFLTTSMADHLEKQKTEDQREFIDVFVSILLSNIPISERNSWLADILINPLLGYIKKNIPTKTQKNGFYCIEEERSKVKIKNTSLDIHLQDFGINDTHWFYWESKNDGDITSEAIKNDKLSLDVWNIIDLIAQTTDTIAIDDWISKANQKDLDLFFEELNNSWNENISNFEVNFAKIKIFKFSDGKFYSYEELKTNNLNGNDLEKVLVFDKITTISEELKNIGFVVSDKQIPDKIEEYFRGKQQIAYFRYEYFRDEFNKKAHNNNLTAEQKKNIFKTFESLYDTFSGRESFMPNLVLFKRKDGNTKPLKQHIITNKLLDKVPTWLEVFQTDSIEHFDELEISFTNNQTRSKEYLIGDGKLKGDGKVYENIILEEWDNITNKFTQSEEWFKVNRVQFYEKVTYYYEKSAKRNEIQTIAQKQGLAYIFSNGGSFKQSDTIFFHNKLKNSQEWYSDLAEAIQKFTSLEIPAFNILPFLSTQPFETQEKDLLGCFNDSNNTYTQAEVLAILEFTRQNNLDFFATCQIEEKGNDFVIASKQKVQYLIKNQALSNYVSKYHSENFMPLNGIFKNYTTGNVCIDDQAMLLDILNYTRDFNTYKLAILISNCGIDDIKREYLNKVGSFTINVAQSFTSQSFEYVLCHLAKNFLQGQDIIIINNLRDKITIENDSIRFNLGETNVTSSTINIGGFDLDIIHILPNQSQSQYASILQNLTYKLTQNTNTVNDTQLETFLKISQTAGIQIADTFKQLQKEIQQNTLTQFTRIEQVVFMLVYGVHYQNQTALLNGVVLTQISNVDFIDFLYQKYSHDNAVISTIQRIILPQKWQPALKIDFGNHVYPDEYALEGEKLGTEIQNWINSDDKKIQFLEQLKLHTDTDKSTTRPDSVAILRSFLGGKRHSSVKSYNASNEGKLLLLNTLKWLKDKKTEISFSSQYLSELQEIYKAINFDATKHLSYVTVVHEVTDNTINTCRIDIVIRQNRDYYYEDSFINSLKHISFQEIHYYLTGKSLKIITLNSLKKVQQPVITENFKKLELDYRVKVSDPTIQEWTPKEYQDYKNEEGTWSVFLVDGKIPFEITLKSESDVLKEYKEGFYYKDEVNKKLYFDQNKYRSSREVLAKLREILDEDEFDIINEHFQATQGKLLDALAKLGISNTRDLEEKLKDQLSDNSNNLDDGVIPDIEPIDKIKDILNNDDTKYTFGWFKALLELEYLYSPDSGKNQKKTISITFNTSYIEDNTQNKILVLKDSNRPIPDNIEEYTDINLKCIIQDKTSLQPSEITIKAQGLSKKGFETKALLTQPLSETIPINAQILKVEIDIAKFSSLISKLKNAFEKLGSPNANLQDNDNLRDNLTDKIEFVFGPPGTGKTTYLAKMLVEWFVKEDRNLKVLILTPTNKASDVIVEKVVEICQFAGNNDLKSWAERYGYDQNQSADLYNLLCKNPDLYKHWLFRYGNTYSAKIFNDGLYYNKELPSAVLGENGKGIVSTTAIRFPYDKFDVKNTEYQFELKAFDWDYIIFDESSMIALSQIVYSIFQQTYSNSKKPQFIVAGDPFQIKPVLNIPDVSDSITDIVKYKEENIYSMIELNNFDTETTKYKHPTNPDIQYSVEYLTTQYRSLEPIGKLFSKFQYNDILVHHREKQVPKPLKLVNTQNSDFELKPITIVRFPVHSFDSIYCSGRVNKSAYHAHTAILTTELVKKIRLEKENDTLNIGIVTPFKTQMVLIAKQIETFNIPNVYTNTVHGFQGDEMDIVIALFNPPKHSILPPDHQFAKYYHLHKKNLVNVAISRARDYLIIFIPDDKTTGINNLHLFKGVDGLESIIHNTSEISPNNFKSYSSGDIENMIWGEKDYIEKNSITLAHEFVNVYEKAAQKYVLRTGSSAIDLLIREET